MSDIVLPAGVKKEEELPSLKACPLLSAAMPQQTASKIAGGPATIGIHAILGRCIGDQCAIWNESLDACGLRGPLTSG